MFSRDGFWFRDDIREYTSIYDTYVYNIYIVLSHMRTASLSFSFAGGGKDGGGVGVRRRGVLPPYLDTSWSKLD